jgi:D-aminopeptidase
MKADCILFALAVLLVPLAVGQSLQRAQDLGVPFGGTPGPLNAITDVKGV